MEECRISAAGRKRGKMKIELIKKHLEKLRSEMDRMRAEEKKYMTMEREAEDAAKLKIIRKSSLTPEELIFLRDMSREEIEMIREKRKENRNVIHKNTEEK